MKPEEGMVVPYFDQQCSLIVEIIKYEELSNLERFKFRVIKKLDKDSSCGYDEGDEFPKERPIGGENGLWGLILE